MKTIHLYAPITNATLVDVQRQLASSSDKEILVRINSPGGSVFDGLAIHQLLKSYKGKVIVSIDGVAASIASIIALAGDEIRIAQGGMVMIHAASLATRGNAEQLAKDAATVAKVTESLEDIYVEATKQSRAKIRSMMQAETWLSAQEAVQFGFAHKVVVGQKIAACAWDPAENFTTAQLGGLLMKAARGQTTTTGSSRREVSAEIDRLRSENAQLKSTLAASPTVPEAERVRAEYDVIRDPEARRKFRLQHWAKFNVKI